MSTFDDRENAFEAKFVHDATIRFRIEARRNKLLGQWAAALLGLSGAEAETYIKGVMKSDFVKTGDGDVFSKLSEDLSDLQDATAIRHQMDVFHKQARDEISQD